MKFLNLRGDQRPDVNRMLKIGRSWVVTRALFAMHSLHNQVTIKPCYFLGTLRPTKGLENLISAFAELSKKDRSYRLIIKSRPKGGEDYWQQIQQSISRSGALDRVIAGIEYIPDGEAA